MPVRVQREHSVHGTPPSGMSVESKSPEHEHSKKSNIPVGADHEHEPAPPTSCTTTPPTPFGMSATPDPCAVELPRPRHVAMNEIGFVEWKDCPYLVTGYLNGCTGVAVLSPHVGLLAHIAPRRPGDVESPANPDPGEQNLIDMMRHFVAEYRRHADLFAGARAVIIVAVQGLRTSLPHQVSLIPPILDRLGIPCVITSYDVLGHGVPRLHGQTFAVISAPGEPGRMPIVCVNNEPIRY